MSKKLISASLLALFFSSASFANVVPGDTDATAPEMRALYFLCDADGETVVPAEAS